MEYYTLLTGEVVELGGLDPALEDFLATAQHAVDNPTVSVSDFVGVLYGVTNPLLAPNRVPGYPQLGYVTRETLEHPAYLVMLDLLARKRIQLGSLDPIAIRDPTAFTMSVATAAGQIGISPSAVRQAVKADRLESLKAGGQHWLRPEDVEAFRVEPRGTEPAGTPTLAVQMGSDGEGRHLAIYAGQGATLEVLERTGNLRQAELSAWRQALVKTTTKRDPDVRVRLIEPDHTEVQELTHGPHLGIRGRFRVVETYNNTREALEVWAQREGLLASA